ncbi:MULTISPECIES: helix-turn-helix transcriptional regulator [Streptomyces]|uniref:AraC family transcriptional regulator n=1 Tax=Streptomyces triticiradicis TaxID=2651189 RepID=A0A7J5DJW2_9ACTN|nr:AraC family transcriptional regulator [Streptomyces triticiradicis]KAB1988998.1 AraC family transcriptional regulator [Streptomyces triticiradicis]
MLDHPQIRAWRPALSGVEEVFHARITDHVYPLHTHDSWTLLIVDDGMVRYDLDRHEHGALEQMVTLLPPHVPHNGRAVTPAGFRKRVVYLDSSQLEDSLIGLAVDSPVLEDLVLRQRIHQLHQSLEHAGEELEAESRLALVSERLRDHLQGRVEDRTAVRNAPIAHQLRDLLDANFVEGISLQDASEALHAHPAHLVRVFSREFGMGPHQYLTSRRVDLARKLLLAGMSPRLVAASAGFYDQSHFNRHFKRTLGTTPGRYARSGPPDLVAPFC